MRVIECTQGDGIWHATRNGRITASRVKDALAFTAKGESRSERKKYMMELLCERLTGESARHYVTPEMERGVEEEPLARAAYEMRMKLDVRTASIAIHRDYDWFAASPDGIIEPCGGVEIKNPTTHKHVEWMLAGQIPEEHVLQCHAVIDVWELDWLDFFSFDRRLPLRHQEFCVRLWRSDEVIKHMHEGLLLFNQELADLEGTLNERNPPVELPEPEHDPAMLTADEIDAAFEAMEGQWSF